MTQKHHNPVVMKGRLKRTTIKFQKLALTILLVGVSALANGGVSDGGGGTTNPDPAQPYWIVRSASEQAPVILSLWANAEEGNFKRASALSANFAEKRAIGMGRPDANGPGGSLL